MLPITERLAHRDATVFVASDSIGPLVERVVAILGTDRSMTVVQRYMDQEGRSRDLDITTSLRVDTSSDERGIHRWDRGLNAGLDVHLAPGLRGFGFAAYDDEGTEAEVLSRYHAGRRRNMTVVRIDAWADSHSREDRIEIDHWNTHGVRRVTTIAFEDHRHLARQAARDVLGLAAAAGMPDTFWAVDSRVLRACETLRITPAEAAEGHFEHAEHVRFHLEAQRAASPEAPEERDGLR